MNNSAPIFLTCAFDGIDSSEWGVYFGDSSLSALLTPAPLKDPVSTTVRIEPGVRIAAAGRINSRDVTLTMYLRARSLSEFCSRLEAFIGHISAGTVELTTRYQPGIAYRLLYNSCTQFTQFNGRLAKFLLKFNEPNPANRTITQKT